MTEVTLFYIQGFKLSLAFFSRSSPWQVFFLMFSTPSISYFAFLSDNQDNLQDLKKGGFVWWIQLSTVGIQSTCESMSKTTEKCTMHQISTVSAITLRLNTYVNVRLMLLIINKTFQNLFVLRYCGILRVDSTETLKQEVWKNFKGSENIPWYVIPKWPPFHYSRPCSPCCLATPSTIRHYTNPPIFPTPFAHLHFTDPGSLKAPWFDHEPQSTAAVKLLIECLTRSKYLR